MKKSNALMLSYIIFLIIALFVSFFGKWNGLDKIVIAATIGGCFFALADYFDWKSMFNKYFCDESKALQNGITDCETDELDFIEERKEEIEYILGKAVAYQGRDARFDSLIAVLYQVLEKDNKSKEKIEQANADDDKYCEYIEKLSNRKYDVVSLVLTVLGFVSFFSVIVFEYVSDTLSSFQSYFTLVAFLVIMFTYYSKDIIENRTKAEMNELIEKLERHKKEQEESIIEYEKLNLSNRIDEFITNFKEEENIISEEESNGEA